MVLSYTTVDQSQQLLAYRTALHSTLLHCTDFLFGFSKVSVVAVVVEGSIIHLQQQQQQHSSKIQ